MKNHLYLLRKKKKIKQYDMATALGVSPSYLSKIETGDQEPTEKFKTNCAKYLKMPVSFLFTERDIRDIFPDFYEGLKNIIWIHRFSRNIRQSTLAEKLEVSKPFLSKVELGLVEPSEKFKKNCVKILKLPLNELFPPGKTKKQED